MRTLTATILASLVLSASAVPAFASEGTANEVAVMTPSRAGDEPSWRPHASLDLGVLSFGGLGAHAGVARGPWTAELGFYRFESKSALGGLLGGFDDEFSLHVDFIVAAQLGYFFNGEQNEGWYGKLIYQAKQQTVTVVESGAEKALFSQLVGPEVGYEWDVFGGLLLRPRLGVLFYAQSPQPDRKPVNVGGLSYDNDTHKWIDAYITVDVGYEFDL
ncbi:MAG: hypothetical protein RL033_6514 [Pseudomonadota bacterium]|jgi:hypothetical protein